MIPKSNLALVGIYYIKHAGSLFDELQVLIDNQIKTLGEYHLTDGIMRMIEQGAKTGVFRWATGSTAEARTACSKPMPHCSAAWKKRILPHKNFRIPSSFLR